VARGQELAAELFVVLDDAVVDHRESTLAVQVRVGVGFGDTTVCGPAGVAQGGTTAGQGRNSLANLADVLFDQQAVVAGSDPPGVIPAVLEFSQALQHQLRRLLTATDVAKDAAHVLSLVEEEAATYTRQ
jgi:hypothetical protein